MPGAVFLEGEKVNLRPVEEEDLEFLRNGVNHPEVRRFMGNKKPQNLDNEREFFENVICDEAGLQMLVWSEGERVGIIGLTRKEDRSHQIGEIGLWLHPDHHGNGYGTEASRLLIDHVFRNLRYHKLYARAYDMNKASQRVWEKLGFEKEGELRDHVYARGAHRDVYYYGILEGEWNDLDKKCFPGG